MTCLRLGGPRATRLITGYADISHAQLAVLPLNLVNFNSPLDSHRRSLLHSPPHCSPLHPCVVTECLFKPSIDTALKGALTAPALDMALPPPSIPSDLEPTQIATLFEHAPQNDNAVPPPTFPSAAPQLAEPQRGTPSMGSRCEHCVSSHERPIPTTFYF
jgi:hypothetical protein